MQWWKVGPREWSERGRRRADGTLRARADRRIEEGDKREGGDGTYRLVSATGSAIPP